MVQRDVAGEPRSLAEIEFVAALVPCSGCGDARPLRTRIGGEGERWTVSGVCGRCATPRELVFHSARDLTAVAVPYLELGGAQPSSVLSPGMLLAELDRLSPLAMTDFHALEDDAWHAYAAQVDRARTALHELAKFGPPPGGPPDQLDPGVDVADQRARPERYTRAWVTAELARWDALAAALAADAPRIFAADRMLSRGTPARGHVDADAIATHAAWLARGKSGDGRLDVVISDADGLAAEGADLAACRLEAVRLRDADLRSSRLEDAELVDVDLRGTALDAAMLAGARLRGCWLGGVELDSATLDRAQLFDCVLADASLVRVHGKGARFQTCDLRGARFGHAVLDAARFADCDLRGASFGALAAGAIFERCDLRGASLADSDLREVQIVDCKLAGVFGQPASVTGLAVERGDFSEEGDGSDLGDAVDLLDELAD